MGWFLPLFPDPDCDISSRPATLISSTILVHSYPPTCDYFTVLPLKVATHANYKPGATVWGRESTSNELFVCVEAEGNYAAYHTAFDIGSGKFLYHFDDHRNGEEIVVDPQGTLCSYVHTRILNVSPGKTLALFTAWEHSLHLRLYDIGRQNGRHIAGTTLPPASRQLHHDMSPEVRTVAWSPDGILLAVGGNDDVAHLYDVRCLERGPVLSLRHEAWSSRYGITVLSWTAETCFRSPTFGLLTGGGDRASLSFGPLNRCLTSTHDTDCIALWDVKTACTERQVVAELDGQVGVANFGDPSQGEKPLVAADADGHVHIYDFVERHGRQ